MGPQSQRTTRWFLPHGPPAARRAARRGRRLRGAELQGAAEGLRQGVPPEPGASRERRDERVGRRRTRPRGSFWGMNGFCGK